METSDKLAFLLSATPKEIEALEARRDALLNEANLIQGQIIAKRQLMTLLTAPATEDISPETPDYEPPQAS